MVLASTAARRRPSWPPALLRRALAAAAIAAMLGAGGLAAAAPPASPRVATVVVGSASAASSFELDGTLQALRQSTVAAQVAGNVVELAVKAGDRVRAGQPLARIDERDVRAGLVRSDAALAQAEAQAQDARVQFERTRELRGQGFVSQAALDLAETRHRAAAAGVAEARAARAQSALARGFATATAPFDAVVQATHVETGELATAGRPLATLYAPGALRAVVQLPASRSAAARAATAMAVLLPDGRRVRPAATTELPATDAVSQTVEWRLDLPPAATAGLSPGQYLRVVFAGAPAAAAAAGRLTVPAGAVLRRGELTAVYAADGGRFVLRAVRVGAAAGGDVEVLAGLKPGERVAVDAVRAGLAGATPDGAAVAASAAAR